jgi:hypothetical protein
VTSDVYDTYSHLKLARGTHTLKGLPALEFIRSRHAFGDGSDLGRTYAQHIFLSAVIRNLKSTGTLANPVALYGLATAGTKALTVDTGLGSITNLLGLAADLEKVPTNRITFTTMQNQPDPADHNRVVPAPTAQRLFALITNDQPLTGAKSHGTAAAAAAPTATTPAIPATTQTVPRSRITVRVENASGNPGRALSIARALIGQGFSPRTSFTTAPAPQATTRLEYGPGRQAQAEEVARTLGLPTGAVQPGATGVTLLVGSDWLSGATYAGGASPAASSGPAPADGVGALQQSHAQTADQAGTCAAVSTQRTVVLNGTPMTPARAFQLSTDIPVSAP